MSAEYLSEDWEALSAAGRAHYRGIYRMLRTTGPIAGGVHPEDRETAREHLAVVLHVDRNRAWSEAEE